MGGAGSSVDRQTGRPGVAALAQPDELARLAETAQPAELAQPIGRNDKYLRADMQGGFKTEVQPPGYWTAVGG